MVVLSKSGEFEMFRSEYVDFDLETKRQNMFY